MRLLCISDIHGALGKLDAILDREAPADAILLAGDLTRRGTPADAKRVIDAAVAHSPTVLAISGNHDSAADEALKEWGVGLHGVGRPLRDWGVVGLSGVSGGLPWHYRLSESEFTKQLELADRQIEESLPRILLCHTPPRNTVDRTYLGTRAGSKAVRAWIDLRSPQLTVCGHIHEHQGVAEVGSTTVVNCGPAFRGRYAAVELGDCVRVCLHPTC